MLAASFFSWWYGRGWRMVAGSLGPRLRSLIGLFSVTQLIRTLFAPWRRIVTYPGASLADKWRAWGDNMVSRVIGFIVRIFVLFCALVAVVIVIILTVFEIIIWPLLPPAIPGCLIAGLLL